MDAQDAQDDRTDVSSGTSSRTIPSLRDRVSAWWAVLRLDLWLDWYSVPGSTGRAMRRELGANLLEAAGEPGGVPGAVRRLGSLRELAREAVVETGGVRWVRGANYGFLALAVVLVSQLLLSTVYVDALLAAGGGTGTLLGNEVVATDDGSRLEASAGIGGWTLLAVPLVFVLVARPWRLVRRAVPA